MERNCDCKDWEENIEKLSGPLVFCAVKGWDIIKPIEYCPWCGKKLEIDENGDMESNQSAQI